MHTCRSFLFLHDFMLLRVEGREGYAEHGPSLRTKDERKRAVTAAWRAEHHGSDMFKFTKPAE